MPDKAKGINVKRLYISVFEAESPVLQALMLYHRVHDCTDYYPYTTQIPQS